MRFNFDAYEKVFPEKAPEMPVESAVDTFKPTESEKATDNKPGDEVMKAVEAPEAKPEQIVTTESLSGEETPEGE